MNPLSSIDPKGEGGRKMKTNVIDILFRVDEICRKYDKYDVDKLRNQNAASNDAFAALYASIEAQIETALKKSEAAAIETNRAAAVAMKAEVRRTKARLFEEVPKLQKLALKKVKDLSREELEARKDLVIVLPQRIQAISDGSAAASNQTNTWGASASNKKIKFDADGDFDSDFYDHSEESNQFRQEYEMRKLKQDQGLEVIAEGLDTLKDLAKDMNEELDRQVPLIDEIDTKADKATSDLRRTNVRLKDTITKMRSSQSFCIDFILICILLGIVMYLYNILR